MSGSLKTAIASIAPTLATMLGGPLAGSAVVALENAFGLVPGSGEAGIAKVMHDGGMTPEIAAAVRLSDQRHAEVIGQQGLDLAALNAAHEASLAAIVVDDRKDARARNSSNPTVWSIAYAVLGTFALIMAAVLYGCFELISGGIPIKDVSMVAAISGLIGSVVGYVAANAQTVVNFIFGGSLSSEHKTDALAASVKQAIGTIAK